VRRRLGLHAAALAVLLVGLVALGGTDSVVSADEGAMVAELDLLDRTGEWTLSNPEPDVDPDQRALPLELSERTDEGTWAPFAKHPVHVALLLPLWSAGGLFGALLLSTAGVVAASVAAGLLAERLRPGAGVVALWATGVGSPLLFDGFQVVGHALGAGTFGLAVVAAVAAADDRSRTTGRRAALLVALAVALAATGLVRSEGVLAGVALAAAAGVVGLAGHRRAALPVAAVAAATSLVVRVGEPVLVERVLGATSVGPLAPSTDGGGLLADRWSGFRVTVLDAGYGVDAGEGLLTVALLLAVAAAAVWRFRGDATLTRLLAAGAATAALGRMVTADFLVPGLLPALPVLAVAVVLLRRRQVEAWPGSFLWATAALFVGAVVATQYRTGGTGEWGGRYFAIALPLLVALAVAAVLDAGDAMDRPTRRVVGAASAVVLATLAIGAVRATGVARDAAGQVAEAVVAEVDGLDVDATVSVRGAVARFAWEDVLDGRRWLTTSSPDDLAPVLERLASDGATRVALVAGGSGEAIDAVAGTGWVPGEPVEVRPGTVVTLLEQG
jgi:hypothetical protein